MSDTGNKAVFLSYASQDAEAVARLAEALRAAGVEVWFDRNELVGGDAWDAKIRQQIRECALFVPVISASTQARAEGYFRREWKLAVERTHDMADHVTFLLPVVIDGTGDAEAFVPEKFREVQWTHLRQGFGEHARPEVLAGFGARVAGILRGEPAGRRPELPPRGAAPRNDATVPRGGSRRGGRLALAGAIAAVAVAAWGLWPRREVGRPDVSSGPAPIAGYAAPLAPAAVPSEAQRLTQQVMALLDDEPMQLRENFFLADELGQRAVKADPTDGEAWAVAGRASVLLARRRFDASATRRELARMQVGRAQSLAPDSLETAYASALLQGLVGDREAEEKLLRELTVRAPGDWRFWLELGNRRRRGDQFDEALRLLRKAAALAPGNSRILADEGGTLVQQFRLAEAEATYARALAGNPGRGAYFRRFALLSIYVYDVPAAKAFLEQIPARLRQEDAVISTAAEFFLRTGDGDRALTELRRLPRDFFEDGWDWRPRGYLAGHAHRIAGRATAAQAEWKQALAAVEKRLAAEQNEHLLLYWRSVLLALTGQIEAARASHKLLRELEPLNDGNTWFDAILLAAMGERETAIATLLDLWPRADFALRNDLWGDVLHAPWFAALRDDPRLRALALAHKAEIDRALRREPAAVTSAALPAAPPEKSVAVLAFDNRSDDKDAEYFSEGISEELINALGRVPGLTVRGRTSAFHFKGRNATAREIGQKLDVAFILRGSVRKAGGRVRITAELSRAATDEIVWTSEPLERELQDVFAVQDEIVGLIAKNLSLNLGVGPRPARAVNPEALNALLEGRHFWVLRTTEGFARARVLFDRAVAFDPDWAPARAALANLLTIEASFGRTGGGGAQELFTAAIGHARRAIALDAALGEPHAALGKIAMDERRYAEAGEHFRRALALEPNNAMVHDWHADLMMTLGRLDAARAGYARALELDPLAPYIQWDLAWALLHLRRHREALGLIERAIGLTPSGSARLSLRRARLLLEMGRRAEAETILRAAFAGPDANRDPQFANEAVWCLQLLGAHPEADRWRAEILRHNPDGFASGVLLVLRGETERGVRLLEKMPTIFQQQFYWDPVLDPVRDTAWFRQLMEKLGCTAEYQVARATLARLLPPGGAPK